MFANGKIDIQKIDGRPYIDLIATFHHINKAGIVMDEVNPEMADVLFTLAQTLGQLATFHLEKDEIDSIDNVVSMWATQ